MNIYLITENYFLQQGVIHALNENDQVKPIAATDIPLLPSSSEVSGGHVFILASSDYITLSTTLLEIEKKGGRVILFPYDELTLLKMRSFNSSIMKKIMSAEELTAVITEGESNSVLVPLTLSAREKTTLAYMLRGMSTSNIGNVLKIKEKTVYTHKKNALVKLGVRKVHHISNDHQKMLSSLWLN
ncbi:helix-turn-helix transcriptional regulator [Serratia fonticola]|uniref:helix-turn-helix transcriptional regulator n=1 Tax=Serratia fonticola TaxID=47917 RepID=UPI00192D1CAC|nr:LuxR family transcriptional regulator [Serratia fonticola]MBL5825945.1 hypothetical protein [Serratia fonticola]